MNIHLTQRIEAIMDIAREECAELIQNEIERVCNEWQAAHPKRTVHFLDAMGSQSVSVDDKAVAGMWMRERQDERIEAVCKDLLDLFDWYISVADNPNVACEYKVGPRAGCKAWRLELKKVRENAVKIIGR